MNAKKLFSTTLVIVVLSLLTITPVLSQSKKEGLISFSGYIDSIPEDLKFIVVNEQRVFIFSATKIADENGNTLKINDLKLRSPVTVEGVKKTQGIFADKITVTKKPKQKP